MAAGVATTAAAGKQEASQPDDKEVNHAFEAARLSRAERPSCKKLVQQQKMKQAIRAKKLKARSYRLVQEKKNHLPHECRWQRLVKE